MTGPLPGGREKESSMETGEGGIRIEQGQSVVADVQARELELERVLEQARKEAGERIERAKAEATAMVGDARDAIDRRRKEKGEAILSAAKVEAEAKRAENLASQKALRDRIAAGIPQAVEETVRAILPEGFHP